MKPHLRGPAVLDTALALGGAAVLILEFVNLDSSPFHIPLIALGALMIYIGVWRFSGQMLHRRANRVLRIEIDHFVSLVRELYSHRTNADAASVYETKAALRESVERIISAASIYQKEPRRAEEGILSKAAPPDSRPEPDLARDSGSH